MDGIEEYFKPDIILPMEWGDMSYSDSGNGEPLLMLHGTGRSRLDWEPYRSYIKNRRLIRPDFRGHGGSSIPTKAFSPKGLGKDLLRLADTLWLGKFDIVAHSLGAMAAFELLATFPNRIGKLVILDGWTAYRFSASLGEVKTDNLLPGYRQDLAHQNRETFVRWIPATREDFWYTVEHFDRSATVFESAHEMLFIYGDRNRHKPPREELGIPFHEHVRLEWLEGAGHFFLLDHVSQTGRILSRELSEEKPPPQSHGPSSLQDLALGM